MFELPDPRSLSKKDLAMFMREMQVLLYVEADGTVNPRRGEFGPEEVLGVMRNFMKYYKLDPVRTKP